MRELARVLAVLVAFAVALVGPAAQAGSAHFVGDADITRVGDTLVVSGKVAGLGNEAQIHVTITALAECINPGSNKPKAANKESVSAEGDFRSRTARRTTRSPSSRRRSSRAARPRW